MADPVPGTIIDKYRIRQLIGQGGMAYVYLADDIRLNRPVALKIIRKGAFPPQDFQRLYKRFRIEARTLARLDHPNIVRIFDFGEYEGSPYLVMEYIGGGTLKQLMEQPVPYNEAAALLAPIADGLDSAHQQGILHRDVKPANILLREDGEPVLTDFGIAKMLEGNGEEGTLTEANMGVGTPEYMAPEQCIGRDIDGRADLYSLGIIFFEMCSGVKPYSGTSATAVMLKQVNDPVPQLSDYIADVPEHLSAVIGKVLAKNPADRYQSAAEFAGALRRLSRDKQVPQPVPLQEAVSRKPDPADRDRDDTGETYDSAVETVRKGTGKKFSPLLLLLIPLIAGIAAALGWIPGIRLFPAPEPTATFTSVPTDTPEPTATFTATATDTPEPTATFTATATDTPEPTATFTAVPTDTPEPTATFTATATDTPEPTATYTATATDTPEPTATFTPTATDTPEPTATFTPTATDTPEPTATFTPTATDTPEPTATFTATPTDTPEPTATATDTPEPTAVKTEAEIRTGRYKEDQTRFYVHPDSTRKDSSKDPVMVKEGSIDNYPSRTLAQKNGRENRAPLARGDIVTYAGEWRTFGKDLMLKVRTDAGVSGYIYAGYLSEVETVENSPELCASADLWDPSADPEALPGRILQFGNFNGIPLQWQVISSAPDGSVLLISRYLTAVLPYNAGQGYNTTWENCSLRSWLNSSFLNEAFTEDERSVLLSPGNGCLPEDKVSLLSKNDAESGRISFAEDIYSLCWLLDRSPVSSDRAFYMDNGVYSDAFHQVVTAPLGVRPVIRVARSAP